MSTVSAKADQPKVSKLLQPVISGREKSFKKPHKLNLLQNVPKRVLPGLRKLNYGRAGENKTVLRFPLVNGEINSLINFPILGTIELGV